MSLVDMVILTLVSVAFGAVVLRMRRHGTCGDCGGCSGCSGCSSSSGPRGAGAGGVPSSCPACANADELHRHLSKGVRRH